MKAAIFDMDGTILDSMSMWQAIVPEFINSNKIVINASQISDLRGMNLRQAADYFSKNLNIELTADEIFSGWNETILNNYLTWVKPKPYACEYISELKNSGIPLAIATLTEHNLCEKALEKHGLLEMFDVILTTEDVGGISKLQPDIFIEAAARLNANISDCVVFEDSLYAIKTAKTAGFAIWAIADKNQDAAEAIAPFCDRYIEDYSLLLKEVKQPVNM